MKRYIYKKAKEYKNTFFRSHYMRNLFHPIYWKMRGVYWDYKSTQLRRSYAGIEPVKPKHIFVITLTKMPTSLESANKCIESGKVFGENVEVFDAIDKFQAEEFLLSKGVVNNSRVNSAFLGCFASHYVLWEKCVKLGEPIVILEHDAVFETSVPKVRFKDIICLSKQAEQMSVEYPLQLRNKNAHAGEYYLPRFAMYGTCGYGITPSGATKLIHAAQPRLVLESVDNFINKSIVDICYLFPPVVRVKNSFSTISNERYVWLKREGYFREYKNNIDDAWVGGSNDVWKDYPS